MLPKPGLKRMKTMNIEAIVNRLKRWRRHRISAREFSHLSDRDLSDLGIDRDDIARKVVRVKFWS
jgi:uncharacterized protein YjiS (DUF1127 family)